MFGHKQTIDNPDIQRITEKLQIMDKVVSWNFGTFTEYTVDGFLEVCEDKHIERVNKGDNGSRFLFFAYDPQNGVAICTSVRKKVEP